MFEVLPCFMDDDCPVALGVQTLLHAMEDVVLTPERHQQFCVDSREIIKAMLSGTGKTLADYKVVPLMPGATECPANIRSQMETFEEFEGPFPIITND